MLGRNRGRSRFLDGPLGIPEDGVHAGDLPEVLQEGFDVHADGEDAMSCAR